MAETRVGEWLVDVSSPLGSGHFARVLPAQRVRADMDGIVERRAVKIYHARGTAEEQRQALAEIRVQEELLGCPHAVAYVDAFIAGDGPFAGCLVQVMELGDRSLDAHLDEVGPLPGHEAATVLAGVAEALEHVHARGLVHADLKPGNIVRCRGLWKIADFNVASVLVGTSGLELGGTPLYMSPRRLAARGGGRRGVRPADDLWSLGVILGQCLLGRLPNVFSGPHEEDALRLAGEVVGALAGSGADPRLVALTGELLSADPDRRPTARPVGRRLRHLAAALAPTVPQQQPVLVAASYGDPHLEVFASDGRGLYHAWILGRSWSGWHAMAAPGPARALAAGAPETYREHLWLLGLDGRLRQAALSVDPDTHVPVEDWSAWEEVPPPHGAVLVDIAASGAPWARHRLYAVDASGTAWQRAWGRDRGWSGWSPLPGTPTRLVTVRPALCSAGLTGVDDAGGVWLTAGADTGQWHRLIAADGGPPARGALLLPDQAVVVLTDEGCALHPEGLFTGPFPAPPPGMYTALSGASRWNGHLELILCDADGDLIHTWATRAADGRWKWHERWCDRRRGTSR